MSGLVFCVSGLVLGCLDLFGGVWTCIFGVWTCLGRVWTCFFVCILVGCDYGVCARGPGPGDPGPRTRVSLAVFSGDALAIAVLISPA